MNHRLAWIVSLSAAGALGLSGCQHCHKSPCQQPPPPCVATPLPVPVPPPSAVTAPVPVPQTPPPAAMTTPPPNWTPPGAATPPGVRNYAPPGTWQPAESQVRLVPPQEPPMAAQLSPPAAVEEKRTPEPNRGEPNNAAADARVAPPPPTPPLPVGIPQFAYAREKEQIASGLRPMLEGLDWLQTQAYKAVVNVRKPGEDDVADRRVVEKRGLKYLSIEVSPQTLSKATLDAFNRMVDDAGDRPLFIYDRDGTLAGALWYLHFRTVGKLSDEEARSRAGRLGLKADAEGDAGTMWLAVQKFLSEQ